MTDLNYEATESIGERCVIYKVGSSAAGSGNGDCICAIRSSGAFTSASDIATGSALQRQPQEIGYRVSFLFTDLEPDTTYYLGATVDNSGYGNTQTSTFTTLPLAQKVPGIPPLGRSD